MTTALLLDAQETEKLQEARSPQCQKHLRVFKQNWKFNNLATVIF